MEGTQNKDEKDAQIHFKYTLLCIYEGIYIMNIEQQIYARVQ